MGYHRGSPNSSRCEQMQSNMQRTHESCEWRGTEESRQWAAAIKLVRHVSLLRRAPVIYNVSRDESSTVQGQTRLELHIDVRLCRPVSLIPTITKLCVGSGLSETSLILEPCTTNFYVYNAKSHEENRDPMKLSSLWEISDILSHWIKQYAKISRCTRSATTGKWRSV